jgi:hypothetical protein
MRDLTLRSLVRSSVVCWIAALTLPALAAGQPVTTAQAPQADRAAIAITVVGDPPLAERLEFLSRGRIVREKGTNKGVTAPRRLTLKHGDTEHDAVFQAIDESKWEATFHDGRREMQFRDYWGFNIAAFEIARLLGYPELVPATVQRYYRGRDGALCWWVTAMADEQDRRAKGLVAPDGPAWTKQVMVSRVFEALFGDTDRNLTNTLITPDWRLVMIDFTRAFRTKNELKEGSEKLLLQCERTLLERLRALNAADVERVAGTWLNRWQIQAMLQRRDRIVAHFERLVSERGEGIVLY